MVNDKFDFAFGYGGIANVNSTGNCNGAGSNHGKGGSQFKFPLKKVSSMTRTAKNGSKEALVGTTTVLGEYYKTPKFAFRQSRNPTWTNPGSTTELGGDYDKNLKNNLSINMQQLDENSKLSELKGKYSLEAYGINSFLIFVLLGRLRKSMGVKYEEKMDQIDSDFENIDTLFN